MTGTTRPAAGGHGLHVDDGMVVDSATHELLQVAGAPLEPQKAYTILMGSRLCTPNSPNEPLAAYARANPAA